MGHNTSQPLEPRSLLAQNWLPTEKQPHVLVHRSTNEQVHKHSVRIRVKDLPRETALFSSRMNSHQPYICRLHYFHAAPEGRTYDHEKDSREMYIYTDRFLRLREWSREKVVFALHGLRRLISVHGPIRISENMVCQNQYGEVKVWISENPANNHPDSKCMSEEQSMGEFAAILTKRNQELANSLIGCLTLKEASQRLNRPQKEESFHQPNHSHRDTAKKKDNPDKTLLTPYKNVFGETTDGIRSKFQHALTPKASTKALQYYPQSSFQSKEEEFNIQAMNSITLGRCRDFVQPNRTRTNNEQSTPSKSHPKSRMSIEIAMEQGRVMQSNYRPTKTETILEFNKRNGTNIKPQQSAKQFVYQPRFQTANNISSHLGYASMKAKQEPGWIAATEPVNLASTVSYHNRRQVKSGNPLKDALKNAGETINSVNNANNYVNNSAHNQILTADNKPFQQEHAYQFRTQSRKDEPLSISPHSSNQFFKNALKGKEKYTMPNFLQQKKKPSSQWVEEPHSHLIVTKCKSNINLVKKDTISSNPQESSNQTLHLTSFHRIQEAQTSKNHQRVFNFNKNYDPTLSGHKSSTPTFSFNVIGPRTPPPASPQNFSSFQKGYSNIQFKVPLRTKTTEFYHKAKDGPKKDEIQNKSFTQHQLEKSIYEQKQADSERKLSNQKEQKEQPPTIPEKIVVTPPPPPVEGETGKLEFKKQLRNQFKFLLGGSEGKEGKQKQEESTRTTLNSKADETEAKEGNLKDKITRKQIVFAELKKEALKVLTDV